MSNKPVRKPELPRRTFLSASLATAAMAGVAACSSDKTPSPQSGTSGTSGGAQSAGTAPGSGKGTDTLRQANRPVNLLNPAFNGSDSPQQTLMQAMMWEGLVRRDPTNSQNYLPGAAEKWDISTDGLTYTFHLRAGATWTNGDPLTADDFVWSYQYYYSPDLAKQGNKYQPSHNGSATSTTIKGLTDFYTGKTKDFSTVGIKATDKQTLVFTLAAPDYRFLDGTVTTLPLHQKSVEANLKDFWLPANLVCNGPYKLTKYTQNGSAELTLNEKYWDAKSYGITKREIQFNSAGSTGMMVSYNANEIDIFRVDGDPTALVAGRSDVAKQLKNGTFVQFKGVQVLPAANPILEKNPKLRQALAMAVDRDALAKVSPPDVAGPSWVPSGITGADKISKIPYDVEGAKKLLAEAGFANGKGVPTLSILTYATMPVLEAVGQMWKKNLNINVKVAVEEVGVYSDMLNGNRPDDFVGYAFNYQAPTPFNMMRYGAARYWEGQFVSWAAVKQVYDIKYGKDKAKYTSSQVTDIAQKLYDEDDYPEFLAYRTISDQAKAAQSDLNKANDLAIQAAQALQDTYLWIPLLWAGYAFMVKPRIHNMALTSYADDMFGLKDVTLDPLKS